MQKTFFGVLALGILVSPGCTVTEIVTAEETELVVATVPKEESQLLDVGVIEFDPGIPENNDPEETRVYDEIRNAESRYLAYHLTTPRRNVRRGMCFPVMKSISRGLLAGTASAGRFPSLVRWVSSPLVCFEKRRCSPHQG